MIHERKTVEMKDLNPQDHVILLIDDELQNIHLITHLLSQAGYRVSALTQTDKLWNALPQIQPSLILLDVVMPQISGYELCRQLKEKSEYADIPIVFLTAQDSEADLAEAFDSGGADYISKPFSATELLARVRNHLILRVQHQRLMALNQEKNEILAVASHDVRGPLANISMSAQLLFRNPEKFDTETFQLIKIMATSAQRCLDMVNDMLDVHRIEADFEKMSMTKVSLKRCLEELYKLHQAWAERKELQLSFSLPEDDLWVHSEPKMLTQVFENLVSNAIKYSPKQTQISLWVELLDLHYLVHIQDQGPGFSPQDREKMYQKFAKLSARPTDNEQSSGLGLSIVKDICDRLDIGLELQDSDRGAHFVLTLKRMEDA